LIDVAAKPAQSPINRGGRHVPRIRDAQGGASQVVRIGLGPEKDRGEISLAGIHEVLDNTRGAAHANGQDAGRSRVEGAGVSHSPNAQTAANKSHDVERGPAGRLVEVENAVDGQTWAVTWTGGRSGLSFARPDL